MDLFYFIELWNPEITPSLTRDHSFMCRFIADNYYVQVRRYNPWKYLLNDLCVFIFYFFKSVRICLENGRRIFVKKIYKN